MIQEKPTGFVQRQSPLSNKSSATKLIKELIQAQKNKKIDSFEQKINILTQINKHIQMAIKKNEHDLINFSEDLLIVYFRNYFIENVSKVQPIKYLRLININEQVSHKYLQHNIPLFISRVIERDQSKSRQLYEQEVLEALKFINDWICKFPHTFPKYLAGTLISLAQLPTNTGADDKKKQTQIPLILKINSVQVVMNLAIHNMKLCCISGGFGVLSNAIIDPSLNNKCSQIIYKLLYFLNEKQKRNLVLKYLDIRKIFYFFTNLDYVFVEESLKAKSSLQSMSKLENQLVMCKSIILSILKSWTGLIYLGNQQTTLRAFLESLKQISKRQQSEIRKTMFSILQELLSIGDTFLNNCNNQSLNCQNQFRIGNILNCYLTSVIQLLIENNLFKILIQLSSVQETAISQPAQRLLKKLALLIFNFFPDSSKYVDFLITATTMNDISSGILKSSSGFIINKIGNYIYDKKQITQSFLLNKFETIFCNGITYLSFGRASTQSIMQSLNFLTHKQKPNYRKYLLDQSLIPKQSRQIPTKWKWQLIQQFLSFPDPQKLNYKPDANQKHKQTKLFKYLLRFYSPYREQFCTQSWTQQTFHYVKVGQLIIRNAIAIPQYASIIRNPPESQFECTVSFVGEMEKSLQNLLKRMSFNQKQFYAPFWKVYQRQIILWIGILSENKTGYQTLLCENNFFEILYTHIGYPSCSLVISTIMHHLDFYRDNMNKKREDNTKITIGPKALLQKCIRQGCKELVLSCIQIIKVLFKTEVLNFTNQGLKLLIFLLEKKEDNEIAQSTIQLLQQILKNKHINEAFVLLLQQYQNEFNIFKSKLTSTIIMKIISLEDGITFILKYLPHWLEKQYAGWMKENESHSYCLKLEALLDANLHFTKKQQPGFRIISKKSFLELLYIYKLPWIAYINEDQYPLHITFKNNKFIAHCDVKKMGLSSPKLQISLGVGAMYVDEHLNKTKRRIPYIIILDNDEGINPDKLYSSSTYGITVKYLKTNNTFQIKKIQIEISLDTEQQNQQLPQHLIQQLTKTKKGIRFLDQKKFLAEQKQKLNQKISPLELRSILWNLGYFGSTEDGIVYVIASSLLDDIIKMSFECQVLSLRGTCRYVLNMFCHTEKGRNYLLANGYIVNLKSYICFPKNSKKFYDINISDDKHHAQDPQFWKNYQLLPMNQNENKLFNAISTLINNILSMKSAMTQIRQLVKNNHKVLHSLNLFQNVINLLSYFKFRFDSRKNILIWFQDLIRSPQFNNDIGGKIKYPTFYESQ